MPDKDVKARVDKTEKQDMREMLQKLLAEERQTTVTGRIVEGSHKIRKDKMSDGKK